VDAVDLKESFETHLDSLQKGMNNQCLIDLSAIKDNIEALRRHLPKENRIMVMVKAQAYGTDHLQMSIFLSSIGIDILGVSYVDEGVALREANIRQDVFVLNAAIYEVANVVKYGFEVGVSDAEMIRALDKEATAQFKAIKVHLHIDTGMRRFGCRPEEALDLARLIQSCPSLLLEGIMTHFTSADDPTEDTFTLQQTFLLDSAIKEITDAGIDIPWRHAANSSASMRFRFPQYNMVRIGLAIYGLYTSQSVKKAMELIPAHSLTSRIVGINICKPGETISYGRSYTVTGKEQRIAVLPIGYFDGLHRHYSGKGSIIIRGCRCPMVGRICMDFMMVDVSAVPGVQVGDQALIFGKGSDGEYLSPEELAFSGGTIAHELITCMGPRIQRVFINR
jgi:alanine racemase